MARLTTREIAERAGVSEGVIFYHFKDRAGLLLAVFMSGLQPVVVFSRIGIARESVRATLLEFGRAVEEFLDVGLDVLVAAQADTRVRVALAELMAADDLGPHRGIAALAAYLREQQQAGTIRRDAPVEVVASMVVGQCFFQSGQRKLTGHCRDVAWLEEMVDAVVMLLLPPAEVTTAADPR